MPITIRRIANSMGSELKDRKLDGVPEPKSTVKLSIWMEDSPYLSVISRTNV